MSKCKFYYGDFFVLKCKFVKDNGDFFVPKGKFVKDNGE
jgi:hypothetical protein